MGGPYCETCGHGCFPSVSIHGECNDPTKRINTGGHSPSCPNITRRSECSNHTGLIVQADRSGRERLLEEALRWYADRENYTTEYLPCENSCSIASIILDEGDRARTTLAESINVGDDAATQ